MSAFISTTTSLISRLSHITTNHNHKNKTPICSTTTISFHRHTSFIPCFENKNKNKNNTIVQKHYRHHYSKTTTTTTTTCQLITTDRLANKSYQLEEDEDESSCTTALYLHDDGSVSLGRTDGPEPDRVNAKWSYNDSDGELTIDIERFFQGEAGIEFMVKRILRGQLDNASKNLQDLPVFTGAMYPYPTDFEKHSAVGFFAMIVATDDLPSEDYDISK